MLNVLICKDSRTAYTSQPWQGSIVVAATLTVCIAMAVPYSGGALNPAAGFSINLVHYTFTGKTPGMKRVCAYILGPLTGAIIAFVIKAFIITPAHNSNAVVGHTKADLELPVLQV